MLAIIDPTPTEATMEAMRSAAVLLCVAGLSGWAQSGSTVPPMPAGFSANPNGGIFSMYRSAGAGDGWSAERPNNIPPPCFSTVPKKASLDLGWMKTSPYQATVLAQQAKQPEDPAHDSGGNFGVHDAPDGKSQYKGGVLTWRKLTWRSGEVIDDRNHCPGKTLDTYSAMWQGYVPVKSLTITLSNFYGGKVEAENLMSLLVDELVVSAKGK
jgi:hypothetical protein